MITKTDPYTGDEFIPSRRNQVYKNRRTQIASNNERIKQRRQSKYHIDKILNRNREILLKTIGGLNEITTPTQSLIEQGFVLGYHTHIKRNNIGEIKFYLYEFEITQTNNAIKITK